ncbi:MAG: tetratricopeptide repeat protein [Elusimicrobiota bacterium]
MRKWIIILAILIGGGWYVKTHYTPQDVLKYAKEHPDPKKAAKLEYYVGTYYFARDRKAEMVGAYNQLLTDHPTCQYAPKALLRVGNYYKDQRDYDTARELYLRYMEDFPEGFDINKVKQKYEFVKFK